MKKVTVITESDLRHMIRTALKESLEDAYDNAESNDANEDEDGNPIVNSEEDGRFKFKVCMWPGRGYALDCFIVNADHLETAIEYVVAWIDSSEEGKKYQYLFCDEYAEREAQELDADGIDPDDDESFSETYYYVDATMEGARSAHYIYWDNLKIERV